ncbi:MAG: cytochrome c, class I [Deltaproteobacteria bacterium]|nr:cytochrome c, class I [Deltaproteobacteria bacterium]
MTLVVRFVLLATVAIFFASSGSLAETDADPAQKAPASVEPSDWAKKRSAQVNRFNRLMKPPPERNPAPAEDGIHDPDSAGTHLLQHPSEAFEALANSISGNNVDWVQALEKQQIDPRYDRLDPTLKPGVLDFDVVHEVKGSMPDVLYPHKQHTEWLDCSNCHPAIFVPKKGANQISMASIMMGEKCGVCHGKVAFPISECRKCHSKNKE